MAEAVFCKQCGQRIKFSFMNQDKPVEFEDGWYCYNCAREKVKKARNKL